MRSFVFLLFFLFTFSTINGAVREERRDLHRRLDQFVLSDSGGANCSDDAGCNNHGSCRNSTCFCDDQYAKSDCRYERKSRLTAFILSLVIGNFGADRYYLGYNAMGTAKLILSFAGVIICIITICVLCCCGICSTGGYAAINDDSGKHCCKSASVSLFSALGCIGGVLAILGIFAAEAWWIADWVLLLMDKTKDYDGYSLYDDF
eukprot:CAMPEP_0174258482 /NCGR_PEP_ID=MMETSP0439-20130205/7463_1 /TAXON_ID=0 /ORGANISM="Stereomyxa ramosa, Strain Chinc5" /LENGTH=204 /DNA_ID=CAMNT_0015342001 /DNA_START=165 /DNA_END=779 /DNA_ORIENTATION=-